MSDLKSVIQELETAHSPTEVHKVAGLFRKLRIELDESGTEPTEDLLAEELAFTLTEARGDSSGEWGLYFGPAMSWTTDSGERLCSPSLELVTPSVLEYWRERVAECHQPLMRARYADLLWELPRVLEHSKPDHVMARVAVESYIDAASSGRHEYNLQAVQSLQRALDIALSLRDPDLVTKSVGALIEVERDVAEDDSTGLWGFSFDRILLNSNPQISVPSALEAALVCDLEGRVNRLASRDPSQLHPFGLEAAATRLAQYYVLTPIQWTGEYCG